MDTSQRLLPGQGTERLPIQRWKDRSLTQLENKPDDSSPVSAAETQGWKRDFRGDKDFYLVTKALLQSSGTLAMTEIYTIETERLRLRQWQEKDYGEFARMNADAEVMRYFPSLLTREQSDALTEKFANLISEKGWGFWVTERRSDNAFIGLVGLNLTEDLPVPRCVEVGWRLDRPYWGYGFATESAFASLHFAFSVLQQERVAAFTAVENFRSRRVMTRLGMRDREENFQHPRVPAESGLREHVYYEIDREAFENSFQADTVSISCK